MIEEDGSFEIECEKAAITSETPPPESLVLDCESAATTAVPHPPLPITTTPAPKRRPAGKAAPKPNCGFCQFRPCSGNNPYCKEDKKEHDALKKDAQKQGYIEKFNDARKCPVLFRKLIEDFRSLCGDKNSNIKIGRGNSRPDYNWARYEHIKAQVKRDMKGKRKEMLDWFDFEERFKKKRFSNEAVLDKWNWAVRNCETDEGGENPDYAKRVRWTIASYAVEEEGHEERTSAVEWTDNMKITNPKDFEAMSAQMHQAETTSAASPNKSPSGKGETEETDIGIARLREFEEWHEKFMLEVVGPFWRSFATAELDVKELNGFDGMAEYAAVVMERIELMKAVADGFSASAWPKGLDKSHVKPTEDRLKGRVAELKLRPCTDPAELFSFKSTGVMIEELKVCEDLDTLKANTAQLVARQACYSQLQSKLKTSVIDFKRAHADRKSREDKKRKAEAAKLRAEAKKTARAAQKMRDVQEKDALQQRQDTAARAVTTIPGVCAMWTNGSAKSVGVLTFETDVEFKASASTVAFDVPFLIKQPTKLVEYIDSPGAGELMTKSVLFQQQFPDAEPSKLKGRCQKRCIKRDNIEGVIALLSDLTPEAKAPSQEIALVPYMQLAWYGILSNQKTCGQDYNGIPCFRYQLSGHREMFAMKIDDLESYYIKAKEIDGLMEQGSYEDFTQWALNSIEDADLVEFHRLGTLFYANIPPKSVCYVPPHFFVWEATKSEKVHGLRFAFNFKFPEEMLPPFQKWTCMLKQAGDDVAKIMDTVFATQGVKVKEDEPEREGDGKEEEA